MRCDFGDLLHAQVELCECLATLRTRITVLASAHSLQSQRPSCEKLALWQKKKKIPFKTIGSQMSHREGHPLLNTVYQLKEDVRALQEIRLMRCVERGSEKIKDGLE